MSSVEPIVTDVDLGGDGILAPGEATAVLMFDVTHRYEPFTYVVDAYAMVSEPCVIEGDVTVTNQAEANTLLGCRKVDGNLFIGGAYLNLMNNVDLAPLRRLARGDRGLPGLVHG